MIKEEIEVKIECITNKLCEIFKFSYSHTPRVVFFAYVCLYMYTNTTLFFLKTHVQILTSFLDFFRLFFSCCCRLLKTRMRTTNFQGTCLYVAIFVCNCWCGIRCFSKFQFKQKYAKSSNNILLFSFLSKNYTFYLASMEGSNNVGYVYIYFPYTHIRMKHLQCVV